ncbi:Aste57867_24365 [Aphanomyces stellatus]|uniref:Aste57867_24365 protein n=1 Tax=Aphanomyces stellatus TaxID=120398 RepID=A0A485LRU0_9STRA|nr:hypothetical protein As57867_024289 [Aphanomyces stellatus]VFU01005.1 Aste57867_24365 [Aphanomyces stellatus]
MSVSSTQTEGGLAEYWKQHNALRVSYLEPVLLVYDAFQKYLAQDSIDEAVLDEKRQLAYYLEFVHFCKLVLEEQSGVSPARPWEDLARVRKYIQNIITPYVAKLPPPEVPEAAAASSSPPKVQVAWRGRRHNASGGRPVIERPSVSSLHPSSPSESHSSMQSDDDMDYWRQHAMLKETQLANCMAVYNAFQQYLARPPDASNAEQRQKLQYLLGYVEFCCHVLSETSQTHAPRPYADYKRVVKSINKIITPYMHKIQSENAATKTLPSVNDLFQRSNSSSVAAAAPPTPIHVPPVQSPSPAAAYWQQLGQLKHTYFDVVVDARQFFQLYLNHYSTQRPQVGTDRVLACVGPVIVSTMAFEHLQEIVYLYDYADFCVQVLQETSHSHPARSMQELQHVYNYIATIIVPHFDKLKAEVPEMVRSDTFLSNTNTQLRTESVVSASSTALQHTDSFLVAFDVDRLSMLSSSVHRSAATDTSMSTSSSSAEAKNYWRKHAALKEIYHDKVYTVLTSFQKYAAENSHAKSAAEARKLARLYEMLEYVEFCAGVLAESDKTHPPRDQGDLDVVHQYIIQIVNPYCQRLEAETTTLMGGRAS